MQFRDLQKQYQTLKPEIDNASNQVLTAGNFISGRQVAELEEQLAAYAGVKHCITCGNGTDALTLALMVWDIYPGDSVFVPDFTFFVSGETPAYAEATPVFVDVEEDTFNMSPASLEDAVLQGRKTAAACHCGRRYFRSACGSYTDRHEFQAGYVAGISPAGEIKGF